MSLGQAISMRSISARATSLRQSVSVDYNPTWKSLELGLITTETAFNTGSYLQVEKVADLAETRSSGPAHEAITDQSDY